MEKGEEIKALIDGFNTGRLNAQQLQRLEQIIEEGEVNLTEFTELQDIYNRLVFDGSTEPSADLNSRFYSMLSSFVSPA